MSRTLFACAQLCTYTSYKYQVGIYYVDTQKIKWQTFSVFHCATLIWYLSIHLSGEPAECASEAGRSELSWMAASGHDCFSWTVSNIVHHKSKSDKKTLCFIIDRSQNLFKRLIQSTPCTTLLLLLSSCHLLNGDSFIFFLNIIGFF